MHIPCMIHLDSFWTGSKSMVLIFEGRRPDNIPACAAGTGFRRRKSLSVEGATYSSVLGNGPHLQRKCSKAQRTGPAGN